MSCSVFTTSHIILHGVLQHPQDCVCVRIDVRTSLWCFYHRRKSLHSSLIFYISHITLRWCSTEATPLFGDVLQQLQHSSVMFYSSCSTLRWCSTAAAALFGDVIQQLQHSSVMSYNSWSTLRWCSKAATALFTVFLYGMIMLSYDSTFKLTYQILY